MKIEVTIPDNFYYLYNSNEFEKEIKLNNALILFMQGKISVSLAAEFSGLDLFEFIHHCRQNNIPINRLSPKDIDNEFDFLNRTLWSSADASPLIALSICNQLHLLEILFDEIALPDAVFKEINIPGKPETEKIISFVRDKIKTVELSDYIISVPSLGKGELEAMALYKKLNADLLLVDDSKARQVALYNNIKVIGSVGVLLLAKRKGIIEKIKPSLNTLNASTIYFSSELYQHILKLAGE